MVIPDKVIVLLAKWGFVLVHEGCLQFVFEIEVFLGQLVNEVIKLLNLFLLGP